jgi:hypothetical protein
MKKILIALAVLGTVATQAHAWGPREQGVVAGIAGTLLVQNIARAHQPVYAYPGYGWNDSRYPQYAGAYGVQPWMVQQPVRCYDQVIGYNQMGQPLLQRVCQ